MFYSELSAMATLPHRPAEAEVPATVDVEATSTSSKEKQYTTISADQKSEKHDQKQVECPLSRQQLIVAYLA